MDIKKAHPVVGEVILKSWNFPKQLVMVPLEYSDFYRDKSIELDYVDLVQVAFLQSIVGTDDTDANVDWSLVPAFEKLGFKLDTTEILDENLSEKIESFMASFDPF